VPITREPDSTNITRGERLAQGVTRWAGSTAALLLAIFAVVAWVAAGPLFHWADVWLLILSAVTSVITFLMVFLIQRSHNKDTLAVHVKLNEIVAAIEGASNHIVNIENLPEEELRLLREKYQEVAERLAKEKPRAALSVPITGDPESS
jgi:low affinity Fe/Cu permease